MLNEADKNKKGAGVHANWSAKGTIPSEEDDGTHNGGWIRQQIRGLLYKNSKLNTQQVFGAEERDKTGD